MTNTYTWTVTNLERYPSYKGLNDVVYRVAYVCVASDGETPETTAGHSANLLIPYDSNEPFINYPNLTNDECVAWVHAVLGSGRIRELQNWLDQEIANKKASPISESAPWS